MKIGIVGNERNAKTAELLKRFYFICGIDSLIIQCFDKNLLSSPLTYYDKIIIFNLSYKNLIESRRYNLFYDLLIFINSVTKEYPDDSFDVSLYFTHPLKQKFIIVNADDKDTFQFINGSNISVITLGLNSKSSITCSSIQENEQFKTIQYCIQRMLPTFSGNKIFPQEFSISLTKPFCASVHSELAAITALLINDIEINKFLF